MEPDQVAIYFAAVKTLALVHFVYFAVRAGGAQRFSQYYASGDRARLEAFVRDTLHWTFWPSLAMVVLLCSSSAGRSSSCSGRSFGSGYPLLYILSVGLLFRASIGPAESLLTMAGQQGICVADLHRDLRRQRRAQRPPHPGLRAGRRGDRDVERTGRRDGRALHRHRQPARHPLLDLRGDAAVVSRARGELRWLPSTSSARTDRRLPRAASLAVGRRASAALLSPDETGGLPSEWRALADEAVEDNHFFLPDVVLPATRHFGMDVRILTVRDGGGGLVALMPVTATPARPDRAGAARLEPPLRPVRSAAGGGWRPRRGGGVHRQGRKHA